MKAEETKQRDFKKKKNRNPAVSRKTSSSYINCRRPSGEKKKASLSSFPLLMEHLQHSPLHHAFKLAFDALLSSGVAWTKPAISFQYSFHSLQAPVKATPGESHTQSYSHNWYNIYIYNPSPSPSLPCPSPSPTPTVPPQNACANRSKIRRLICTIRHRPREPLRPPRNVPGFAVDRKAGLGEPARLDGPGGTSHFSARGWSGQLVKLI